ncbi:hypothetical protein [Alkaliphilus sp. B6464]|uniref:hypothetical protein n=1 Tax=Alkaliphilus sp. B6464 TaxID=2731219 RepID=UPI001BACE6E2|nr:hypothetical protein [Alkaliphilus sp. B6464]QUH22171.1 hypothetical protein HYG84_19885 [Alkaliphilus sp. B6464]
MNKNKLLTRLIALILSCAVVYVGIQLAKNDPPNLPTNTDKTIEDIEDSNKNINESKEISTFDKKVILIGYIVNNSDNYKLLGWSLEGDLDFNNYLGKSVEVSGTIKEKKLTILVDKITVIDENHSDNTTMEMTSGKLEKIKEVDNKILYRVENIQFKIDNELSDYEKSNVFIVVKNEKEGVSQLKEIYKTIKISGKLIEILDDKTDSSGRYLYKIDKHYVVSDNSLSEYVDKEVTLEVYDVGNGLIEESLVNVVKIIE